MRDVLPELMAWWRAGETVGVGTVVATFQSAPRPPGASMMSCSVSAGTYMPKLRSWPNFSGAALEP